VKGKGKGRRAEGRREEEREGASPFSKYFALEPPLPAPARPSLVKARDRRAGLPGRFAQIFRQKSVALQCFFVARSRKSARVSRHPCSPPSILRCFPFKFTYFLTHDVTGEDTQESG